MQLVLPSTMDLKLRPTTEPDVLTLDFTERYTVEELPADAVENTIEAMRLAADVLERKGVRVELVERHADGRGFAFRFTGPRDRLATIIVGEFICHTSLARATLSELLVGGPLAMLGG